MGTRATYKIAEEKGSEWIRNYFYIHWDSYPQGAAEHLKDFLNSVERFKTSDLIDFDRKTYAGIFEMGVKLSERTISHSYHADTEYRYDIVRGSKDEIIYLTASKNSLVETDGQYFDCWTEFFRGELQEFIDKYEWKEEVVK